MREQTHRLCSSCVLISWICLMVSDQGVWIPRLSDLSDNCQLWRTHFYHRVRSCPSSCLPLPCCCNKHPWQRCSWGSRRGQDETLKVALNVSARTGVSCESLDGEGFDSELLWLLAGFSSLHVTREGGRETETETEKNRDRETLLAVTWSCPCMSCLDISLSLLMSSQASKRERIC